MPQPILFSLIDKVIYDYNLIQDGDKILIGASGGKDSTALIEYFANRVKRHNCNFEYKALAIQSDFSPSFPENIKNLFDKWNVPFEIVDVDIMARLKPGRKMNCYWCSTQRRSELLKYAMENGFNKIALGHHLDDVLETLLMNMIDQRKLTAMPPLLTYDNYPVSIIRPLSYAPEDLIIEHATLGGFIGWTCTCNYQENSNRKKARQQLEVITGGDRKKKTHIYESLKNIDTRYLP